MPVCSCLQSDEELNRLSRLKLDSDDLYTLQTAYVTTVSRRNYQYRSFAWRTNLESERTVLVVSAARILRVQRTDRFARMVWAATTPDGSETTRRIARESVRSLAIALRVPEQQSVRKGGCYRACCCQRVPQARLLVACKLGERRSTVKEHSG